MWRYSFWNFLINEGYEVIERAKCGEGYMSTVPTVLWAVGASAFAHRLLISMFRKFMFRRVAVWEQILQHLLFVWMVLYSLHFWHALVSLIKLSVAYYDYEADVLLDDARLASLHFMQQWVIWLCGVTPLAVFLYSRPRPSSPPLMIWITTSPWQRREMGPYGYYLNRPFSILQSFTNISLQERTLSLRRALSDSKIIIKEPPKKRRISKSI